MNVRMSGPALRPPNLQDSPLTMAFPRFLFPSLRRAAAGCLRNLRGALVAAVLAGSLAALCAPDAQGQIRFTPPRGANAIPNDHLPQRSTQEGQALRAVQPSASSPYERTTPAIDTPPRAVASPHPDRRSGRSRGRYRRDSIPPHPGQAEISDSSATAGSVAPTDTLDFAPLPTHLLPLKPAFRPSTLLHGDAGTARQ